MISEVNDQTFLRLTVTLLRYFYKLTESCDQL